MNSADRTLIIALENIYGRGCIDPLAGPNPRPDLLETHPNIDRCGKYVSRPDYELCNSCVAKAALDAVGYDVSLSTAAPFGSSR